MNHYGYFCFLQKPKFQYVDTLSLKHYVDINTMSPFISIHNTNKWINKKNDTQLDKNEKEDVSVPIHQVQIPNKSEYQKRKRK